MQESSLELERVDVYIFFFCNNCSRSKGIGDGWRVCVELRGHLIAAGILTYCRYDFLIQPFDLTHILAVFVLNTFDSVPYD